jgi:hypothetical protein
MKASLPTRRIDAGFISLAAIMPHAPASGKPRGDARRCCYRLAIKAFSAKRNGR